MKVILVGGPASGKTTIGKSLAAKWGFPFYDTDQWVEAEAGKSIRDIFAEEGEATFRLKETQALKSLLKYDQYIIATGGGIIEKAENQLLLAPHLVVYLDVSVKVQMLRTNGDTTRPLLISPDKAQKLEALRAKRDPLYRNVAKLIVAADLAPADLVLHIEAQLEKLIF